MPYQHEMSMLFLGTGSGGGPTSTRNSSSSVLNIVGDGSLWMVDCAEGTTRQFEFQPFYGAQRYKWGQLTNIFITHMHADHTMGLIGLLKKVLGIPTPSKMPVVKIQLFGPCGLRNFVRQILTMTDSKTQDKYVVHELLGPEDLPSAPCTPDTLHSSESHGKDVKCDEDGFWREFIYVKGRHGWHDLVVDAGPIKHRAPCIGYVFRESRSSETPEEYNLGQPEAWDYLRKVVVLGDTHCPDAIVPLITQTPGHVSLLVHEATDCCIPPSVDPHSITGRNRTTETVDRTSLERGHSTPVMAGEFARTICAERLYLNHLGGRFPAPSSQSNSNQDRFRVSVMREIEKQATEAWNHPLRIRAVAASDFARVTIPPVESKVTTEVSEMVDDNTVSNADVQSSLALGHGRGLGRGGYRGTWRGSTRLMSTVSNGSKESNIGDESEGSSRAKKRTR